MNLDVETTRRKSLFKKLNKFYVLWSMHVRANYIMLFTFCKNPSPISYEYLMFGVGIMEDKWKQYPYIYVNIFLNMGGDIAQEVRAVVWQSEGWQFDPTLGMSKCPWARHLTLNCSWRAGWYLACRPIAVGVWMGEWVNGWMRSINCTALWIKALYKNAVHFSGFQ